MTWNGRVYLNGALQDIVLMQFTGFYDKNGSKIFEGDLIRKNYGSSIPVFPVAWHDERGMFIQHNGYNEPLHQIASPKPELSADIEVIGNIYEDNNKIIEDLKNKTQKQ
ncbi:YopX family protein [bacterium]|nr:YopX family protein [bacterium]